MFVIRYYFSKVIEDIDLDTLKIVGYRNAISYRYGNLIHKVRAWTKTTADGIPNPFWCLCEVKAEESAHQAIQKDNDIYLLESKTKWDNPIAASKKNAIQNAFPEVDLSLDSSQRQIITKIGKHLDTQWEETWLEE